MNELREKLKEKIKHLEGLKSKAPYNDYSYLNGEVNALQDVLVLLQSQPININGLKYTIKIKNDLISSLQCRIKELEKENERLKLQCNVHRNDINGQSKAMDNLRAKITQLQKKIDKFILLESKYGMYRSLEEADDVRTFLESLTNKTDEQ